MAAVGFGLASTAITTVKQPHEYEVIPYKIESFRRMASGLARKDVLANVGRWRIGWRNLTYSQWQVLEQFYQLNQPIWFRDLEGATYLVIIVGEMASPLTPMAGGTRLYSASWDLEWAGADAGAGVFTIGVSTIGGADTLYGIPGKFTIGASVIGGSASFSAF